MRLVSGATGGSTARRAWQVRMARVAKTDPVEDPADDNGIAVYVASMSASLAELARRNGHETLGYLLELACLEAEAIQAAAIDDNTVA